MDAKLTYPQSSPLSTSAVAAIAALIAIGLLTAVAFLFQRDGTPLEQLATAERACIQHTHVFPQCAQGQHHRDIQYDRPQVLLHVAIFLPWYAGA